MNVDKAALKMALAQTWARSMEDLERKAEQGLWRLDGGADALRQAATALEQHRAYYQEACDAGKLDGPQTKVAMEVITRCVGGLQNLADKTTLARQLKQGELAGVRSGIDMLEKEYRAEQEKVLAVEAMIEQGDKRPDGRPANPVADDIKERRAAKKKKTTKKKATRKKVRRA